MIQVKKVRNKKVTRRNPLVAPTKTRSGAGRHIDKRKRTKHKEKDYE